MLETAQFITSSKSRNSSYKNGRIYVAMRLKKILSLVLFGALCFSMTVTSAFAYSNDMQENERENIDLYSIHEELYTQKELTEIAEIFSGWEDDELNEYISYLSTIASTQTSVPTGSGQAAWLAAAGIIESTYPCTAALIRSSVYAQDYIESVAANADDVTGLFQTTIKSTSQYRSYVSQLQSDSAVNGKSMVFESSQNKDLAYSLHACTAFYTTITSTLGSSGNTYAWYIYDVYDFAWDEEYNAPIVSMINNAAYLSQQIDVLNVIDVYIHFVPVSGQ